MGSGNLIEVQEGVLFVSAASNSIHIMTESKSIVVYVSVFGVLDMEKFGNHYSSLP